MRAGGTVPEDENVQTVMREFIELRAEEIPRAHDIGSGTFIPAKITSDGWIVEGSNPRPVGCLDQGWMDYVALAPTYIRGLIQFFMQK